MKIQTISDIIYNKRLNQKNNDIFCDEINSTQILNLFYEQCNLKASISILVLSGHAILSINYKNYEIRPNTLILLSGSHLFSFFNLSDDFKIYALLVSREFTDSTDSTEMIHKRMRYEIMVFNNPIIKLRDDILGKLIKRLEVTTESIKDEDHIYQRELILNSVYAFYLDISNQIDRIDTYDTNSLTHQESIINRFIELLVKKYRTQHKADFYASELGITPHYLSLLLKRITTQTASDFIYEMIFSEARNLLKHSKLSIQEIAAELNFSDQSSFGKFFKKKSGISPKEFRNKV